MLSSPRIVNDGGVELSFMQYRFKFYHDMYLLSLKASFLRNTGKN